MPTTDPGSVYPRDASRYDSPDVTSAKATHWPGRIGTHLGLPMSACGRVPIVVETPRDPARTHPAGRCRGSGCRQRWDAWVAGAGGAGAR